MFPIFSTLLCIYLILNQIWLLDMLLNFNLFLKRYSWMLWSHKYLYKLIPGLRFSIPLSWIEVKTIQLKVNKTLFLVYELGVVNLEIENSDNIEQLKIFKWKIKTIEFSYCSRKGE